MHKTQEEKIQELRDAGIQIQLIPMAVLPHRIYGLHDEVSSVAYELMDIDEAHRKVCGHRISYDPFTDEYLRIR